MQERRLFVLLKSTNLIIVVPSQRPPFLLIGRRTDLIIWNFPALAYGSSVKEADRCGDTFDADAEISLNVSDQSTGIRGISYKERYTSGKGDAGPNQGQSSANNRRFMSPSCALEDPQGGNLALSA